MKNNWILLIDQYEGLQKTAIDRLYAALASKLPYVLPIFTAESIGKKEKDEANIILVGIEKTPQITACQERGILQIPQEPQGYSIYVGESMFSPKRQMIVIGGYDEAGLLYGCADFCNRYLSDILYYRKDIWHDSTFDNPFADTINEWRCHAAPAIRRRAIWTWGHVIYDYRRFFENMAALRLNEVVIWNDVAPINAKEVVNYAHSLHIKVIWGFAWGWETTCKNIIEQYDEAAFSALKKQVIETYETQYAPTNCDGIYFQSFTELKEDHVGGRCIAELVTALVNDISTELLYRHPDLHIQFGLHATSVQNQLEHIGKVDPRIHIVWEDCGCFPYHYFADRTEGFEKTLAFTKKTLHLRGKDEKWGAVLKGMLKLDWRKFEHFSAPYIMGERTNRFLQERQIKKDRIWKIQRANWLENAEYARKIIAAAATASPDVIMEALVEDAMLENEIALPVALYAEMLWRPHEEIGALIGQVAKYEGVK